MLLPGHRRDCVDGERILAEMILGLLELDLQRSRLAGDAAALVLSLDAVGLDEDPLDGVV